MLDAVHRRQGADRSADGDGADDQFPVRVEAIERKTSVASLQARSNVARDDASGVPDAAPAHAWIKHDRDSFWFDVHPGERMTLRAPGQGTGTAITLCESRISPGSSCPLHVHRAADETIHVLAGTLVVECGTERCEATEGTTVVIPRGLPHAWSNTSAQEARVLTYFTPGGIEDYFVKVARLEPQERRRVARQHDSTILSPSD